MLLLCIWERKRGLGTREKCTGSGRGKDGKRWELQMGGKWEESGNYVIMFKNSQSKKAKKREAKQKKKGDGSSLEYTCAVI